MSWQVSASVLAWSAWAPGLNRAADWQAWAEGTLAIANTADSPPVDFVPALQRRRLSQLSRLALATAHACAGEQQNLSTVFASRHGELHRTARLLADLAQREPLSPMAFSLSVHNTASGLYAINAGNTAPSTAVAAGADTLAMALLEAAGQLLQREQVLLVYAEEPLPVIYRDAPGATDTATPFSLALLLGRCGTGRDWTLAPIAAHGIANEADGFAIVRTLLSDTGTAILQGERQRWHWSLT